MDPIIYHHSLDKFSFHSDISYQIFYKSYGEKLSPRKRGWDIRAGFDIGMI